MGGTVFRHNSMVLLFNRPVFWRSHQVMPVPPKVRQVTEA